nr:protein RALF-like 27 [Ipomoea batatas]
MRSEAYSGRLKYPQGDTCISCRHLFLFVFLTFFVMLSTTTKLTAASLATTTAGSECTGTVGGCMEAVGEEFLMDSETTRRLLDGGPKGHIGYNTLDKRPICGARRYGSCLGNQKNKKMNCNFHNKSCV